MKKLARWIRKWGLERFILYSGLSLMFICLIVSPDTLALALQANPTATSQSTPSSVITETPTATPEPEVEGQVGANAGLVCGAVILVIIIIAGLMRGARWMQYRGHDVKGEGE